MTASDTTTTQGELEKLVSDLRGLLASRDLDAFPEIKVLKATREGALHFYLDGEYRPRAVFGDFTVEGARRVNGYVNAAGLIIREEETA